MLDNLNKKTGFQPVFLFIAMEKIKKNLDSKKVNLYIISLILSSASAWKNVNKPSEK